MLPVAGLIIGACGAVALGLGVEAGLPMPLPVMLAGAVAVLVTGGLHEDGLADTADGLGGGHTLERKLAIMRDSRIGTYGVLAVGFAVALRLGALAGLVARTGLRGTLAVLLAAAVVSRALALLPLVVLDPARADGLGRGAGRPAPSSLLACVIGTAVIGIGLPLAGGLDLLRTLVACGIAIAAAAALTRLAWRQIGGHTGDIAGACQQVAEIGYLLGLLAFGTSP